MRSTGGSLLSTRSTEAMRKRSARVSAARQSSDVLLRALAERDSDLGAHLDGVGDLACATARRLGVPQEDMEAARQTGLLHDVGKVAIPDSILNKPGPLDEAEWALMKRHTVIGEQILAAAPALAVVASLVRSTHERYDGAGYPDGLAGDDIPLTARIVAVCDAYDAMVTKRAYRDATNEAAAVAELRRCSGTQFDPEVTEAFVSALEAGDYRGHFEDDSRGALALQELDSTTATAHRASLADWAEFERRANERDQAGDRRDQAADQRDQVGDERDEAGDRRDKAADKRDQAADKRDEAGDQRDHVGDERDEAAQERDHVAEESETRASAGTTTDAINPLSLSRQEAASDRRRASQDRQSGATARTQAGLDRGTALAGRGAGAIERTQAGLDRDTALADRGASARDRQLSSVDDLTGVYSPRAGLAELKREVARARRTKQPLLLACVDVDDLDAVNDSRGHAAGDRMLVEVAQAFRGKLRPYDLIIRYGGDQFVCAISGLTTTNATKRLALANAALAELPEHASVTVGLAELRPGDSPEHLIARADAALIRERQRQQRTPAESVETLP